MQKYLFVIISDIMSQHQVEISELQCLLRSTQEKLQIEFQTNAEQVYKFNHNFLKIRYSFGHNS